MNLEVSQGADAKKTSSPGLIDEVLETIGSAAQTVYENPIASAVAAGSITLGILATRGKILQRGSQGSRISVLGKQPWDNAATIRGTREHMSAKIAEPQSPIFSWDNSAAIRGSIQYMGSNAAEASAKATTKLPWHNPSTIRGALFFAKPNSNKDMLTIHTSDRLKIFAEQVRKIGSSTPDKLPPTNRLLDWTSEVALRQFNQFGYRQIPLRTH